MSLKATVLAVAFLFAGTAAAATLYTDNGTPANRINVADVSPLEGALALGEPLWLPAGQYTLPTNFQLTGTVDLACAPGATITLAGESFIVNGAGSFIARGCTFIGDGNDSLVSLNAATEIPALIDNQDATMIGVSTVNWSEFGDDGLPLIGKLVLKRITLDAMNIGRGDYVQNGVVVTEIEDYEVFNFRRFGLLIGVYGTRQQDLVQRGTFKRLYIHDGQPTKTINANGLYVAGRNYYLEDTRIERFLPPNAADVPSDGSECFYSKTIGLRILRMALIDCRGSEAYAAIKGQSWDGSTGPGPRGGMDLIEDVWIEDTGTLSSTFGAGIAYQSRGGALRRITTIGLTGPALMTHQTAGPVIVQIWNDSGRDPLTLTDPGKGVFFNRSDLGDAGVMTIMGSSVQPEFLTRATPPNPPPGRIIHDEFGNNWN